ncbi:MAG: arginase [Deltaproteobacteria bacterium]|nr:arginase [Deltaproteobacteria bacterium]
MTLVPRQIDLPQTAAEDPRVGSLLGRSLGPEENPRLALVGFPVDLGVVRNGGREGASAGPDALRRRLYRLCPDPEHAAAFSELLRHTRDLGDLQSSGDLARDQEALGELTGELLQRGTTTIVLGGGHEASFGHFLGFVAAARPVAIQNFDAHADVRELKAGRGHSGSPFRQALDHPSRTCTHYRVDGLQRSAIAAVHLGFLHEHRAEWGFSDALTADGIDAAFAVARGDRMATFCLDAIDRAFAPGVSAPATGGLEPRIWLHAAEAAGHCPDVRALDVVELNPGFDRDEQTASLAALTVWHFLRGVCRRKG